MSKKNNFYLVNFRKVNFIFISIIFLLVICVLSYNFYFTKNKITIKYRLHLIPENYNSKIYLLENLEMKNLVFDKLYFDEENKTKFKEISLGNKNQIFLKTEKIFNRNEKDLKTNFITKYDNFFELFKNNYEKELSLNIKSTLKEEYDYIYKLIDEMDELQISNKINKEIEEKIHKIFFYYIEYINYFNTNKLTNLNNFHKNIILIKNSQNFDHYLKLKKIIVKISKESDIIETEENIAYIDLLIVIIAIAILYYSIYFFLKNNLK